MYNAKEINKQIRNLCDFNAYKQSIIDTLKKDYGWSQNDIDAIKDELNVMGNSVINSEDNIKSSNDLEETYKNIVKQSNTQINQVVNTQINNSKNKFENAYIKKVQTDFKIVEQNYLEEQETIYFKEPIVTGVFTTPINIPDSHYSLKQNYPNSYGTLDPNGNYFKVNLEKNQIDLVHSSGTLVKIDKDGNVTMHIVGSKKEVIEGDYTLKVKGNMDLSIDGSKSENVLGIRSVNVGGVNTLVAGVSDNTIAPKINHN